MKKGYFVRHDYGCSACGRTFAYWKNAAHHVGKKEDGYAVITNRGEMMFGITPAMIRKSGLLRK